MASLLLGFVDLEVNSADSKSFSVRRFPWHVRPVAGSAAARGSRTSLALQRWHVAARRGVVAGHKRRFNTVRHGKLVWQVWLTNFDLDNWFTVKNMIYLNPDSENSPDAIIPYVDRLLVWHRLALSPSINLGDGNWSAASRGCQVREIPCSCHVTGLMENPLQMLGFSSSIVRIPFRFTRFSTISRIVWWWLCPTWNPWSPKKRVCSLASRSPTKGPQQKSHVWCTLWWRKPNH